MAADAITIPREAAFEAAAFLEAIAYELGELGADTNALYELEGSAYEPLVAALNVGAEDRDDELMARGHEIAEQMAALVDLNFARRLTALEDKRTSSRFGSPFSKRSTEGNGLRCVECDEPDDGERGWTLRFDVDDELVAFCPDCDREGFGHA